MIYFMQTLQRIDPTMEVFKNGGLQVTMTVLNPFSVGTMWLRPRLNDSEHQPITNPSYLQDDRDLSALVKGRDDHNLSFTWYSIVLILA